MNAKKLLITSALAASLTLGAGAALAQTDSGTDAAPDAPPTLGLQNRFGNRGFEGRGPGGRFGFDGPIGRGFGLQGGFGPGIHMGVGLELIQEYTGLEPIEIRQALRDGQTLAELFEANGQSVDDFIAEAVAAGNERIDTALANMAERAGTLRSTLEERITAAVNGEIYQPPATEVDA